MLLNSKRKWTTDICNNVAESHKPVKEARHKSTYCLIPLHEIIQIVKVEWQGADQ